MPLNPLDEARYLDDETQLAALRLLITRQNTALVAYATLAAGLTDMRVGGRLTEAECPDDIEWLDRTLATCTRRSRTLRQYDLTTFRE